MNIINFDDIIGKKFNTITNVFCLSHPKNALIIGNTGSGKTNILFNLIALNSIYEKIYIYRKNNNIFIFDSFGIGHIPRNIYEIYKNFTIITNIYRIQHINSNLCGLFSILFCLYKVNSKHKFIEFFNLFNFNDYIKNELV